MTAAHCITVTESGTTYTLASGLAYFGSDGTSYSDPDYLGQRNFSTWAHHPDWNPADATAGNDIALILLTSAAPSIRTSGRTCASSASA